MNTANDQRELKPYLTEMGGECISPGCYARAAVRVRGCHGSDLGMYCRKHGDEELVREVAREAAIQKKAAAMKGGG